MDQPLVLRFLADGADRPPPKLIAAIGDYADGVGPAPQEIIDVALAERFGWTWQELDEQDLSQVLPAVAASNIYAAIQRVMPALYASETDLSRRPREADLKIYFMVMEAQKRHYA